GGSYRIVAAEDEAEVTRRQREARPGGRRPSTHHCCHAERHRDEQSAHPTDSPTRACAERPGRTTYPARPPLRAVRLTTSLVAWGPSESKGIRKLRTGLGDGIGRPRGYPPGVPRALSRCARSSAHGRSASGTARPRSSERA